MKGWSCSAENSFAALRARQTSSKTSLCLLSLARCVLQHSISPGARGKLPRAGDLKRVWHKAPAAAGGTDLAQAGSWPSAEAVPG